MPARLPDHFWSSAALFLLPALSLVLPSGYSYAPALLIIVSLINIRLWWGKVSLPKEVWWMYGSLALLAFSWLIDGWISGESGSAFEKPAKILATLPCMYYLAARPPQARWLWHGAVLGAIGAASISLYEAWTHWAEVDRGVFRPNGFTNAIQFGDLSLLLGMLALCGWNIKSVKPFQWRLWLVSGFIAAMLASLFSGARGGWLTFVLLAAFVALYLAFTGHFRAITLLIVLSSVGAYVTLQIPPLHIQDRIRQANEEAQIFLEKGNASTSVGARLQMWQFAWERYREKPLLGWSQRGYMQEKQRAVDAGRLNVRQAEYNHPHNELLDAASKRGSVGLVILLSAYLAPLILFFLRYHTTTSPQNRAVCIAGMLVPIAYLGFGLTQSFLPHNSGITFYVYVLCLIWAAAHNEAEQTTMLISTPC